MQIGTWSTVRCYYVRPGLSLAPISCLNNLCSCFTMYMYGRRTVSAPGLNTKRLEHALHLIAPDTHPYASCEPLHMSISVSATSVDHQQQRVLQSAVCMPTCILRPAILHALQGPAAKQYSGQTHKSRLRKRRCASHWVHDCCESS
jgi:hypothetical protein